MKRKLLIGVAVFMLISASTVFAINENNSNLMHAHPEAPKIKITAEEFEEMDAIIKGVNTGELPISALKEAEIMLERNPNFISTELWEAYRALGQ